MKTRNPVAGNMRRYNRPFVASNKKPDAREREIRDYWVEEAEEGADDDESHSS